MAASTTLSWHIVTAAEYKAGVKSDNSLYFLSDTHEIYRGNALFSQAAEMFTGELPLVKATNRIYINDATLEGSIWTGTAWKTIIQPLGAVDKANTTKPVSGASVMTYVDTAIAAVTGGGTFIKLLSWDATNSILTSTKGDNTTSTITFEGLATSLQYTSATGVLQLKDASNKSIGAPINLDLERFIKAAAYDPKTNTITLTFNDTTAPLVIDVSGLVDTYTTANSTSIAMTVADHVINGTIILSTDAGNIATVTAKGLYVPATDITGKLNKLASTDVGEIVTVAADGMVVASGTKVGGATLSATPDATTVATEAAVAAVRTALTSLIDGKMSKLTAADVDEIVIVGATGDSVGAGVKIGAAAFAATPLATTVATEAGVSAFVAGSYLAKADVVAAAAIATTVASASDTKAVSEKAYVSGNSWKTAM